MTLPKVMENGSVAVQMAPSVDKKDKPSGPQADKPSISPMLWQAMLVVGVCVYGSETLLVHLCEVNGKIPFSSAAAVLAIEVVKLVISVAFFIPEYRKHGLNLPGWSFVMPFIVPALLYFINNNMAVIMQTEMDSATFQILCNMKILTTAICYKLIIKKPITPYQWVALTLLTVAGIVNSYGGYKRDTEKLEVGTMYITMKGLLMMAMFSLISGFTGVYTEYILKNRYETSIHIQNSLLYTFGIFFNAVAWVMTSERMDPSSLFDGFTIYTWMLVCTQALTGLIISGIVKHGSNIIRLFLISCAMLFTTLMSMLLFHLTINLFFCIAFILVITALYLNSK